VCWLSNRLPTHAGLAFERRACPPGPSKQSLNQVVRGRSVAELRQRFGTPISDEELLLRFAMPTLK
jgi:hypothetical protein